MRIADLEYFRPQYIINENGEKTNIILPVTEFYELLEDIEDLAIAAERRNEPTISHNELLEELRNDGIIQN